MLPFLVKWVCQLVKTRETNLLPTQLTGVRVAPKILIIPMSELFGTLLVELGERIARNSKTIGENRNAIERIAADFGAPESSERVAELVEVNRCLQAENRTAVMLQLRLRSLLSGTGRRIPLKIELLSGIWIDEGTEHFLLSSGDIQNGSLHSDDALNGLDQPDSAKGPFDLDRSDYIGLVARCVQAQEYGLCSLVINAYSSVN